MIFATQNEDLPHCAALQSIRIVIERLPRENRSHANSAGVINELWANTPTNTQIHL